MHLTALVLYVAYSANFISSLAVQKQDFPFKTFQDLLTDGTFKIGVRAKSAHEDYFKVRIFLTKRRTYCGLYGTISSLHGAEFPPLIERDLEERS
jgi:hypothetical protein